MVKDSLRAERAEKIILESDIKKKAVNFVYYVNLCCFCVLRKLMSLIQIEFDALARDKKTLERGLVDYENKFKQLSDQQSQSRSFDAVRASMQISLDDANRKNASLQSNNEMLQVNLNNLSLENTNFKVYKQ